MRRVLIAVSPLTASPRTAIERHLACGPRWRSRGRPWAQLLYRRLSIICANRLRERRGHTRYLAFATAPYPRRPCPSLAALAALSSRGIRRAEPVKTFRQRVRSSAHEQPLRLGRSSDVIGILGAFDDLTPFWSVEAWCTGPLGEPHGKRAAQIKEVDAHLVCEVADESNQNRRRMKLTSTLPR